METAAVKPGDAEPGDVNPIEVNLQGPDGPVRVLVVEDDEDAAETTRRLLLRYGARVEVSHTAADAVARLQRLLPELALIDLRLPDRDGFDLVVELRARLSDIVPICIAVSGIADAARDARATRARFDRYLLKPVEPTLLRELVETTRTRRCLAAHGNADPVVKSTGEP